jgi:hypothetical protein
MTFILKIATAMFPDCWNISENVAYQRVSLVSLLTTRLQRQCDFYFILYMLHYDLLSSQSRIVGIATRLQDGGAQVSNPTRGKYSSLLQNVQPGFRVHTASYSMGTGVFLRGKTARPSGSDSPFSSARVKNEWIFTSAPPYAFVTWTRQLYFFTVFNVYGKRLGF